MSGVVVEVRVKEGHEIKKGDPLCGKAVHLALFTLLSHHRSFFAVLSAMKVRVKCFEDEDLLTSGWL